MRILGMVLGLCALLLLPSSLSGQRPEVVTFSQVEQWASQDNDTLYVLNFWATWCKPCVAEMPYFEQVQQDFADRKVKVVFVSMDFKSDYEKRLVPFVQRKKLKSQVVLLDAPDYNAWIDKVSPQWSGAIPATLFVQHGRGIREFHEGEYDLATLSAKIETLLKQ